MNYAKVLLGALVATTVMTIFMLVAPFIGLPNANVAQLLAAMFKGNLILGWVGHFAIGVFFAIPYVLFFNKWLPVENRIARGAIYGIVVFIFSQIIFYSVNLSGALTWAEKESMGLMVFVHAIACMIYGAVLGAFVERVGVDAMEEAKHSPAHMHTHSHSHSH